MLDQHDGENTNREEKNHLGMVCSSIFQASLLFVRSSRLKQGNQERSLQVQGEPFLHEAS
jgi:hypothetical protein